MTILCEEQLTERVTPSDLGAEKAILGAIICRNDRIAEVSSSIEPGDFYLPDNRRIYQAMLELTSENLSISRITICDAVSKDGGAEINWIYIESLNTFEPAGKVTAYCAIVKEKARLRRIVEQCNAISVRALDGSFKALQLAGDMQETALEVQAHGNENMQPILATMDAMLADVEARRQRTEGVLGLSVGIDTVDQAIGGIQKGEFCIVAARPGRGKTHLLIQAAIANAVVGIPVVFFSIEMRRRALEKRLAGHFGKIPSWMLRDERHMPADVYEKFRRAAAAVAQLPIVIEDSSGLTTRELQARAILATRRFKAGLIIVDYAQRLTARGSTEVEREVNKSIALCQLAKDHAPVLAAAQLSRAPGHDLNKLPNLQDIKGSSQYEQDAHLILMIHRPVDEQNVPLKEDWLFIEKNREGEPGREPVKMTEWADFTPRAMGGGGR